MYQKKGNKELRFQLYKADAPSNLQMRTDYVQVSLDLTFVERDTSDGLGGTSGLRCLRDREAYEFSPR